MSDPLATTLQEPTLSNTLSSTLQSIKGNPLDQARAPMQLLTVMDWFRFAVTEFESAKLVYGHGCADAVDEAAFLILQALKLPLDKLDLFANARLLPHEAQLIFERIRTRVKTRKPAPYIAGEAWLNGYKFYVDERVIVPRSFIGELLKDSLQPWVTDPFTVQHVLDLCCGSGCLGIMAADAFPGAQIDAVDLSKQALEVARINVRDYQLEERIRLVHSDLFDALRGVTYDVIVTNPPYVNAASVQVLPPEYLHEPVMALGSGNDGMDAIRVIIAKARQHLNPNGVLVVELGHERSHFEAAFPDLEPTWLDTAGGGDAVFVLHAEQLPEAN